MIDRFGNPLDQGEEVVYLSPERNHRMKCRIISSARDVRRELVEVQITGDPFPSWVEIERIQSTRKGASKTMPTKTAAKPTVKTLRAKAKTAEIDGWEEMDREELEAALAELDEDEDESEDEDDEEEDDEAEDDEDEDEDEDEEPTPAKKSTKKSSAKKVPAKKVTAKKAAAKKVGQKKASTREPVENENGNPFREGSNLYLMTEQLIRGGKRSVMVTRLLKKIDLKPRVKGGKSYDEAAELDYRIVRCAQQLKKEYGFTINTDGRGPEQKIQAVAP